MSEPKGFPLLKELNAAYWKRAHEAGFMSVFSACQELLSQLEAAIMNLLLCDPNALRYLRGTIVDQLGMPLQPRSTVVWHGPRSEVIHLWEGLRFYYDNAQRSTFTALLCLRIGHRLRRDMATLICRSWVWPSRFTPGVWVGRRL